MNLGLRVVSVVSSRLCGGVEGVQARAKVIAGQVGHVDRLGGGSLHAGEFCTRWGTLQEAEAAGVGLGAAFGLGQKVHISWG